MNKIVNSYIVCKKYINKEDIEKINKLKEICLLDEKLNLKLELDYKINILNNYDESINDINEFLYYINDELVGYVSISCFDGKNLEITGMVHPSFRKIGIFKKLSTLAIEESNRRKKDSILLLFDERSKFAKMSIEKLNCDYSFSEYLMNRNNNELKMSHMTKDIILVKVDSSNLDEVRKLAEEIFEEIIDRIELDSNSNFYLVKKENKVIGKIRLNLNRENLKGFISWFGIKEEFRRQGYGRAALNEALRIFNEEGIYNVSLEVNASNKNALNLYKDSGFKEELIMNYYKLLL